LPLNAKIKEILAGFFYEAGCESKKSKGIDAGSRPQEA
jgi:hypothetical protein